MKSKVVYIVLLVSLLVIIVFLWVKLNKTQEYYEISTLETSRLSTIYTNEVFEKETLQREVDFLKNKDVLGFEIDSNNVLGLKMVVYYTPFDSSLYVKINKPVSLERTKKLQLWGVADSQFFNMGNFRMGLTGLQNLGKVKNFPKFVLTEENEGKVVKPSNSNFINLFRFK